MDTTMSSCLNLILISLTVLFEKTCFAAPIVKGPRMQRTNPGEWAAFTCTVSCSHTIDWFVEGHKRRVTETCTENSNGMTLCKEIVNDCSSDTSTSDYVEILRVLANPESAPSSIAVQCAAVAKDLFAIPFTTYSKYALLTVQSEPTQPPTLPSPSPTPVVCPTAVQDHTVTHTVTRTVVIEATPVPKPVNVSGSGDKED